METSSAKPSSAATPSLPPGVARLHHTEVVLVPGLRWSPLFLCCRRHASLPVEVLESPVRLESAGRRRDTPCRKWKSASFGYSKTRRTASHLPPNRTHRSARARYPLSRDARPILMTLQLSPTRAIKPLPCAVRSLGFGL